MEERLTPGLWLEMTELPAAEYADRRVPEVLTLDGVERATWWENACRDRTDLPREMPEFGRLGVYQVTDAFVPPAPADGIAGHHFRRYPRPGQGTLSGRPTVGLLLVLISPKADGQAQALRDWADFVHIRHIAAIANPGYTMITPYENATGRDPRFMHFYEMDTDEPEAAFRTMTPRVIEHLGGGFGTRAFDEWAFHDALRIVYVNTFRRVGERAKG